MNCCFRPAFCRRIVLGFVIVASSAGCREPIADRPVGSSAEAKTSAEPSSSPEQVLAADQSATADQDKGDSDKGDQDKGDSEQPAEAAIEIPENRLLAAPVTGVQETQEILDTYVGPHRSVQDRMLPPPDCKPLGNDNHLWVDRENGRVIADGYVAMRHGVLEMFACPMGTKEHESVVATLAESSEMHAALLTIGATPGTPVQFVPKFRAATGQVIRVWVCWRDEEGQFHSVDARSWIQQVATSEPMDAEWVFAGSGFWKDPSSGREHYQADSGDMICVSNFSTAMLDVSIASSAEADNLLYQPATDSIPERGTPVRLVLVSIPNPTDVNDEDAKAKQTKEREAKKNTAPSESVLPPLTPIALAEDTAEAIKDPSPGH